MYLLKELQISDSNFTYRANKKAKGECTHFTIAAWLEVNRIKNMKELQSNLVERKSSFQKRFNGLHDFKPCFVSAASLR